MNKLQSPVGNRTYAIGSRSSGEIAAVPFASESHGESMVVCCCEEVRLETGPTQSGAARRGRSRRRLLRRSLTENRWSSAAEKKSGWKPDLRNREPLVGGDRDGAFCAVVSRRIDGRLRLRRSPVGNRTYAGGAPVSPECANCRGRLVSAVCGALSRRALLARPTRLVASRASL
jgi:hypothetical protein